MARPEDLKEGVLLVYLGPTGRGKEVLLLLKRGPEGVGWDCLSVWDGDVRRMNCMVLRGTFLEYWKVL
jgi:hypothetical protein